MDQYEIQEGLAQLDKFERLARYQGAAERAKNQQRQTDKAFQKAMAKAGVTPQDWQRMISEDPEGTMEAFKDHVKSYVKTVEEPWPTPGAEGQACQCHGRRDKRSHVPGRANLKS